MFGGVRRRKIMRARVEAVDERATAISDFVEALSAAEDALANLKAANDRFYRADDNDEQGILSSLRRDRERLFLFHVRAHLVREAPAVAHVLGLKHRPVNPVPLKQWIQLTNSQDLRAIGAPEEYPSQAGEAQNA